MGTDGTFPRSQKYGKPISPKRESGCVGLFAHGNPRTHESSHATDFSSRTPFHRPTRRIPEHKSSQIEALNTRFATISPQNARKDGRFGAVFHQTRHHFAQIGGLPDRFSPVSAALRSGLIASLPVVPGLPQRRIAPEDLGSANPSNPGTAAGKRPSGRKSAAGENGPPFCR